MNPSSSLRWRARIAKEALAFPFENDEDDNSADALFVHAHTDNNNFTETTRESKNKPFFSSSASSSLLLRVRSKVHTICSSCTSSGTLLLVPLLVSLAIVSSLYSLRSSRSLLVTFPVTCTVIMSLLVLVQQRQRLLSSFKTKRGLLAAVQDSRQKLESLRLQRERWYRQILQLEDKVERLRQVQHELALLTSTDKSSSSIDLPKLTQIAQTYKQYRLDMQKQLQRHVQEQILKAVLLRQPPTPNNSNNNNSSNNNNNNRPKSNLDVHDNAQLSLLSEMELEQLIRSLKAIPGVSFRETYLREMLVDSTGASATTAADTPLVDTSSSSPTFMLLSFYSNVFRLLRQVESDVETANVRMMMIMMTSAAHSTNLTTPPRRKKHSGNFLSPSFRYNNKKQLQSTIFTFDDTQHLLLPQQQQQQQVAQNDSKLLK